MGRDHLEEFVSLLRGFGRLDPTGQVEIIPADDAVLDQSVTTLGDLLTGLVCMFETARISDRDGPGETVREFDLVELLFNRLAQLEIVDIAQGRISQA